MQALVVAIVGAFIKGIADAITAWLKQEREAKRVEQIQQTDKEVENLKMVDSGSNTYADRLRNTVAKYTGKNDPTGRS
ncbi:hypothetical protein EBZ39_06000 [bacterium]|nr:hypothetical protein [bacterium]